MSSVPQLRGFTAALFLRRRGNHSVSISSCVVLRNAEAPDVRSIVCE
jgi:hypothetical protein